MPCNKYYRRDGTPYSDMMDWATDVEGNQLKRVAETTLPDGKWVSTVWLGLCHSFHGLTGEETSDPHLIFETMVFPSEDNLSELAQNRYATEQEALQGHAEMVKEWFPELVPDEDFWIGVRKTEHTLKNLDEVDRGEQQKRRSEMVDDDA